MRGAHRALGLLMVLPLLVWLVSGMLLTMVGAEADERVPLEIATTPFDRSVSVRPDGQWVESKLLSTVLGQHLLQRTDFGWRHLDPTTGQLKPLPTERQMRALLDDTFSGDPERYGSIEVVSTDSVVTSTGRVVYFDWASMTASERMAGWRRVALLRRFHRLEITDNPAVDRLLSIAAAIGGCALALMGLVLLAKGRRQPQQR